MPIWEAIGLPLEIANVQFGGKPVINTSYSSVIGDGISYFIGGGRFTNIYGTDVKLVIDWEELLVLFMGQWSTGAAIANSPWFKGIVTGIGGDTGLAFGNKTGFLYYGQAFDVKRTHSAAITVTPTHPLKAQTVDATSGMVLAANDIALITKLRAVGVDATICDVMPNCVKWCFGLGALLLLGGALALRFYSSSNGIYNSSQASKSVIEDGNLSSEPNEQVETALFYAANAISFFEIRWLYLLELIELQTQTKPATVMDQVEALDRDIAKLEGEMANMESQLAVLQPFADMPGPSGFMIFDPTTVQKIGDLKTKLAETSQALKTKVTAREKAIATVLSSMLSAGFHPV
jgi:hypothetical protein